MIPAGRISAITQKMESFLPNYPNSPNANLSGNVNTAVLNNNYLGTQINGRDSHLYDWRVDYDWTAKRPHIFCRSDGAVCVSQQLRLPISSPAVCGGRLCHHRPQAIQRRGGAYVHWPPDQSVQGRLHAVLSCPSSTPPTASRSTRSAPWASPICRWAGGNRVSRRLVLNLQAPPR